MIKNFTLSFVVLFALFTMGNATVTGTIRDNLNAPMPNVFVRFVDATDSTLEVNTYTDAVGQYVIRLPGVVGLAPYRASQMESGTAVRSSGWLGQGRYTLLGRRVESFQPKVTASSGLALTKSSAARLYHVTVYGKSIYPLKARNLSINDGDTRDFQLKHIDLWDSSRTILRDNFSNCRNRFEVTRQGRVAFLGGSITFNSGWRDSVMAYLRRKYPLTTFDFINAGIPSVDIKMHAFRLQKDVFFRGKVDMLFVESAVNDTSNGVTSIERTRAYEGIIRQAIRHNPNIDVAYMYFAHDAFYAYVKAGQPIPLVTDYEKSAWQYAISSINLAQYVAERYTWSQFGNDVHPGALGTQIYGEAITRMLNIAWSDTASAVTQPLAHFQPVKMLDTLCFANGHMDSIQAAQLVNGWKSVASWTPTSGGTRDGFVNVPALEALTARDTLKFVFTGTAIGIVVPAGPDVGMLDYYIDNQFMGTKDQFTQWSAGLNLPWTILFNVDLPRRQHELKIVTSTAKNTGSVGNACRIFRFLVNGP